MVAVIVAKVKGNDGKWIVGKRADVEMYPEDTKMGVHGNVGLTLEVQREIRLVLQTRHGMIKKTVDGEELDTSEIEEC